MVNRVWSVKEKNDPFVVPSFETVSFSLPSVQNWEDLINGQEDGWVYLSDGNPTLAVLEQTLARIQGVESCWVTSTGKSAIAATLLTLLNQNDHIILLREGYKSTRLFAQGVLKRFGVSTTLIDVDETKRLEEFIQPGRTKLIMLEAPTNPITRVPDLHRCTGIAKEHNVITVLDNSLASFHQHGNVPADVIVLSLSKYASGAGDVMGGAILGSTQRVKQIKSSNVWNTDAMSPHTAVAIWKGVQTYDLRIERQVSNAMAIAHFLEQHPRVGRVMYPGLPSHPDHEIAAKQMKDFGSVLAFDIEGGKAAMSQVLDRLKIFRLAFGTGFTQSIASPAFLFYARSFPEPQTGPSAVYDNTIRLSIGIEPQQELLADLENALN